MPSSRAGKIRAILYEEESEASYTRRVLNTTETVPFIHLFTVVRRPISANTGLNFNLGFFFFCSKEFFRIIFSILFRPSNHQAVDKKNKTD